MWAGSGLLALACGSGGPGGGTESVPRFDLGPSAPDALVPNPAAEGDPGSAATPDQGMAAGAGDTPSDRVETNLPAGTPLEGATTEPEGMTPGAATPPGDASDPAQPGDANTGDLPACGVVPVNPNATAQARNLLCYLYSIYGNFVLSGQQETSWANPQNDIDYIRDNTGEFPAILGGDLLYPNGTTDRAIAYWNAGGIPMLRYHMGAPPLGDSYDNSMGSSNIAAVLTEGTAENRSFMSKLDYAARELQRLEDAGAAVLWAPFHESQPNGWFWYAKGNSEQLIQMWRIMFDYLTQTKGLDNLIWIFPSSGSPNASIYPGTAYSDLAGPDTYARNQPFTQLFRTARGIFGETVPIPLHETGTIPDPEAMFNNNAAPWVLFSVWAGYEMSNNSVADLQRAYTHERTLNRDDLPSFD